MAFKRTLSSTSRVGGEPIERGFVDLTSKPRRNTSGKNKSGNVYVCNVWRIHRKDAQELGIHKGDTVDLLIDPIARIGCFQRCMKGRKVTGDRILNVQSTWRPEDPCCPELTKMKILRGTEHKGVILPEGLCFEFPKSVSFSTECQVNEVTNISNFNKRYSRG